MSPLLALLACAGDETVPEPDLQPTVEPLPEPSTEAGGMRIRGRVDVVTMKNGSVAVPGSFSALAGKWDVPVDGTLTGLRGRVDVDMESWDSEDPERDERIERIFFEVDDNRTSSFVITDLEGWPEDGLEVGASSDSTVFVGEMLLSGATVEARFPVRTTRHDSGWHFVSSESAELSIEAFGLGEQLAALVAECQHESISDAVQVRVDIQLGEVGAAGGQ